MRDGRESCRCFLDFIRQRARAEEEYARSIERLNKNVDFSAEIGTLRASADELKQQTDKMTQEHYSAGRKLTEHAQMFGDFMELQRKNRIKEEELMKKVTANKQQAYTKAIDAKRRYYEKSQQSDTLAMTLKDAHTLKSTYAPRKWDNMVKDAKKASKAASDSECQYRDAVETVNGERDKWEHEMKQFAKLCAEQDVERYTTLHDEMWHICDTLSTTCVNNYEHCESVCASLQAVDADKDIAEYVSRAATGTDRPAPVKFEAFHASTASQGSSSSSSSSSAAVSTSESASGSHSAQTSRTMKVVPFNATTFRRH